jgi:Transposase DDE domain
VGAGLPAGSDRAGRAQEPAAHGGPARAQGPRPAAPLRHQPGLGRRAAAAAPGREGGRAGRRLAAEFAASRVRPAEGAQLRNGWHLPGAGVWLVGERRPSGEQKYYLSNLPADATLEELAATIKARWVCEQAHQQLKAELGLGHFEGRSRTGLHRHALMAMIAFAFLQHLRLRERGKKPGRTAAPADVARGPAPADRAPPRRPDLLPALRGWPRTRSSLERAQVVLGPA